jgi:hypothetical protein
MNGPMGDFKMLVLEGRILRYFRNKEIIAERKEENELLPEEIVSTPCNRLRKTNSSWNYPTASRHSS